MGEVDMDNIKNGKFIMLPMMAIRTTISCTYLKTLLPIPCRVNLK